MVRAEHGIKKGIVDPVCGSDKGNVSQAGCFGYSLVEMAFVLGQEVINPLDKG